MTYQPTNAATYSAIVFIIKDQTDSHVGSALIVLEVRYASVVWAGSDRIDRAFMSPALWKDLSHQVSAGLLPQVLDSKSPIAALLVGRRDLTMQYLHALPVTIARPTDAATVLDQQLRQIAPKPPDRHTAG
jgi:hypothetical protein